MTRRTFVFALPLERVSYLHVLNSRLQKNLRRVRAYIGICTAHIEKQNHMCQKTADSEMLFFEYCLKGQQGLA